MKLFFGSLQPAVVLFWYKTCENGPKFCLLDCTGTPAAAKMRGSTEEGSKIFVLNPPPRDGYQEFSADFKNAPMQNAPIKSYSKNYMLNLHIDQKWQVFLE
jgi:hypothetical protein